MEGAVQNGKQEPDELSPEPINGTSVLLLKRVRPSLDQKFDPERQIAEMQELLKKQIRMISNLSDKLAEVYSSGTRQHNDILFYQ